MIRQLVQKFDNAARVVLGEKRGRSGNAKQDGFNLD
jgi:hypothetical protein